MLQQMRSYDLMMGYNTQEGSLILSTLKGEMEPKGYDIEDGIDVALADLMLDDYTAAYFPRNSADVKATIKHNYEIPEADVANQPSPRLADTVMNVYSDLLFASPALTILDLHSNQAAGAARRSTYMYRFTLETQDSKPNNPSW